MKHKVGIPRALLYYEYAPLWVPFFNEIGAEVVVSPPSNKKILNHGTTNTVDDACIPLKLFQGHLLSLKDVDYLFVPRLMGVYHKEYICPKFCGLPDMVKHTLKDIPEIINTKIDLTKKDCLKESMLEIGSYITNDKKKIIEAYYHALNNYQNEKDKIIRKDHPVKKTIMLMGHPYLLNDDFLNMNIKKKLKNMGYEYLTPEYFEEEMVNQYAKRYHGKLFWLFFRKMIGTTLYLIEQKQVEGIIYISSFGCGIDSVVAESVERRIRKMSQIPFMLLILDEHSGEAGFNTRLEAFMDMLKWRNQDENDISPYGDNLYPHKDDAR